LEKDLWDRIIAVNLTAPMMVTKLGVNHMLEKQIKGSIINIGSVAALRGFAAGKSNFHKDTVERGADTRSRRRCLYLIQAWSCRLDEKHSCILHGKGHPVQRCTPVRNGNQHLQYHQEYK
jgi:NAD(P)-dependent dehydrogenase (short-subunit alcohol dehydrogenase family)